MTNLSMTNENTFEFYYKIKGKEKRGVIKVNAPQFQMCEMCGEFLGVEYSVCTAVGHTGYINNNNIDFLLDELYHLIEEEAKLNADFASSLVNLVRKRFCELENTIVRKFKEAHDNGVIDIQEFDVTSYDEHNNELLCDSCRKIKESEEYILSSNNNKYCYSPNMPWKAYINHGMFAFWKNADNIDTSDVLNTIKQSMSDVSSDYEICGSSRRHCGPIGVSGWATTWMWSQRDVWSYVDDEGYRHATEICAEDHDEYWFSGMEIDVIWVKDWYLSQSPKIEKALRSLAKERGLKFEVIRDEIPDYRYREELSKDDARLAREDRLIAYYEHLLKL